MNPFCGVTVTVVVPLFPAFSPSETGDKERLKSAAGKLILYVAVVLTLLTYPLATATALMVSELLIVLAVICLFTSTHNEDPSC